MKLIGSALNVLFSSLIVQDIVITVALALLSLIITALGLIIASVLGNHNRKPYTRNIIRNHKYFLMFIFSTLLSVLFITILAAARKLIFD